MFRSHAVSNQWDTWAFVENGTFYAFYLVTGDGSPGEGFGVATSSNGATTWHDHGFVWHHDKHTSSSFVGWEGTGAVWRRADFRTSKKYVVNFSQSPTNGLQNISFAESTDLIHWHDVEAESGWFNIDQRYYDFPGRWDCIYSFPFPNSSDPGAGPRYGAWTATPNQTLTPNSIWGFGYTYDGIHWTALPSPKIEWGSITPFTAEMGAIERLQIGRTGVFAYYALVGHCCNHMNTFVSDGDPATGIWRHVCCARTPL
jgi:hypothetical protein